MRSIEALCSPEARSSKETAGNTGIGLAVVANAMGFRTVIVIPDTQSEEKKDALRLLGAGLIRGPSSSLPANPNNYVEVSGIHKDFTETQGPASQANK